MRKDYKYQIWLHLSVFIFGTTGILGKLISLGSYALVWYRLLIALFALFFVFSIAKRSLALDRRTAFTLLAVGLILGAHWLTFFEAIKRSNVSASLVCFSSVSSFCSTIFIMRARQGRCAWPRVPHHSPPAPARPQPGRPGPLRARRPDQAVRRRAGGAHDGWRTLVQPHACPLELRRDQTRVAHLSSALGGRSQSDGGQVFLVGRIFLARGGIFLARRNPCYFRRRFSARPL